MRAGSGRNDPSRQFFLSLPRTCAPKRLRPLWEREEGTAQQPPCLTCVGGPSFSVWRAKSVWPACQSARPFGWCSAGGKWVASASPRTRGSAGGAGARRAPGEQPAAQRGWPRAGCWRAGGAQGMQASRPVQIGHDDDSTRTITTTTGARGHQHRPCSGGWWCVPLGAVLVLAAGEDADSRQQQAPPLQQHAPPRLHPRDTAAALLLWSGG